MGSPDRAAHDALPPVLTRPTGIGRRPRQGGGAVGSSSRSSQPRKASRLRVDSPRESRHSHSLRIDDANPSSRIVLKDSSAYVSTDPSSRSSSSARDGSERQPPVEVDVAVVVDPEGHAVQPEVAAQQPAGRRPRGSRRGCGRRTRAPPRRGRRQPAGMASTSLRSPGRSKTKTPGRGSRASISASASAARTVATTCSCAASRSALARRHSARANASARIDVAAAVVGVEGQLRGPAPPELLGVLGCVLSQSLELGRVGEQPLEHRRVVPGVVTVDEDAAHVAAYGGRQATDVRSHDRSAAGLRLDGHQAEGLVVRRHAHQGGRPVVVDELGPARPGRRTAPRR